MALDSGSVTEEVAIIVPVEESSAKELDARKEESDGASFMSPISIKTSSSIVKLPSLIVNVRV